MRAEGSQVPAVAGEDAAAAVRLWRVRQRFTHPVRRSLGELLDDARRLERAMARAGQQVAPASVLIRTAGLDVQVTVHGASSAQAAREGLRLIALLAVDAGVDDLGDDDGEVTIRPAGRGQR